MSEPFEVNVTPPPAWNPNEVATRIVCDGLHSEVLRHLKGSTHFRAASLSITFELYNATETGGDLHSDILVGVYGTVNGRDFEHQLKHKSNRQRHSKGSGALASQGLPGLAASIVMGYAARKSGAADWADQRQSELLLTKLRDEFLFNLLSALDQFVGLPASQSATKWKIILATSVAAYLAAIAATGIGWQFTQSEETDDALVEGLILGALCCVPVFFAAMSFGLMTMPREFFENETLGKKLVTFSGAKSAKWMKLVCFLLGLGFCGTTAGVIWLMLSSF